MKVRMKVRMAMAIFHRKSSSIALLIMYIIILPVNCFLRSQCTYIPILKCNILFLFRFGFETLFNCTLPSGAAVCLITFIQQIPFVLLSK